MGNNLVCRDRGGKTDGIVPNSGERGARVVVLLHFYNWGGSYLCK